MTARRPSCLATLALGATLLAILTWAGCVVLDRHFVYFPSGPLVATPGAVGLPYEEVRFGEDGRLHGWFVPGSGGSELTLLWLHGNAGNISHRVELMRLLRAGLGVAIFIFDYGGYGLSRGEPSEAGLYRDARDALAYLRTRPDVDPGRLVYFGKSIGGAVAIELAVEHPPHRLIAQSSFTSLLDLGRLHYPLLPAALLVRGRYPTLERIAGVRAPILIVHGSRDSIVPLEQARRLYDAAPEPKRLYVVEGAGHNDVPIVGGGQYVAALREFLLQQFGP